MCLKYGKYSYFIHNNGNYWVILPENTTFEDESENTSLFRVVLSKVEGYAYVFCSFFCRHRRDFFMEVEMIVFDRV